MSKGWISVHRQIWNSWVWDEKPFSKGQAWIDLLLLANHEDRKVLVGNQLVIVKRGSFITSQTKLMERWGWGKEKLRNFLRLLESDEMIEVDTTPRYTHIAITNYETYQTQYQNQTNENPVIPINREEYQTKDRPKTDQRQTANRPNTDRTPTTNNNDNNLNNDNKDKIKKILIYLIKNVFKYNNMNAGFLACIYNFKFGKYIDDNYVKIMIVDKQYFKWYIDNIDNIKDDELPNLKEIYKIYYGEE